MNFSNRRKILYVSQERISDLLREKENSYKVTYSSHVPETAELVWTHFCYERASFALIFQDESFDEIPEGQQYPIIPTEAFIVVGPAYCMDGNTRLHGENKLLHERIAELEAKKTIGRWRND